MKHPFLFVWLARKQEAVSSVSGNLLKKQLNSAKLNDMDLASISPVLGQIELQLGFGWHQHALLAHKRRMIARQGYYYFFHFHKM